MLAQTWPNFAETEEIWPNPEPIWPKSCRKRAKVARSGPPRDDVGPNSSEFGAESALKSGQIRSFGQIMGPRLAELSSAKVGLIRPSLFETRPSLGRIGLEVIRFKTISPKSGHESESDLKWQLRPEWTKDNIAARTPGGRPKWVARMIEQCQVWLESGSNSSGSRRCRPRSGCESESGLESNGSLDQNGRKASSSTYSGNEASSKVRTGFGMLSPSTTVMFFERRTCSASSGDMATTAGCS